MRARGKIFDGVLEANRLIVCTSRDVRFGTLCWWRKLGRRRLGLGHGLLIHPYIVSASIPLAWENAVTDRGRGSSVL